MSSIVVNDIFEELSEENKRLLNELMFANKCLNVLNKLKTFVDLVFNKLKTNLELSDSQKYEEINKEIVETFKEREITLKSDDQKINTSLISSPKISTETNEKSEGMVDKLLKKWIRNNESKDKINQSFHTNIIKKFINKKGSVKEINRVQYVCDYVGCSQVFRTKSLLKKHFKSHGIHFSERYYCGHNGCDFQGLCANDIKEHLNGTHNGIKPYKCGICGKEFNVWDSLNKHNILVHKMSDKSIVCEICNKEFKNEMSFRYHQKWRHFTEKTFKCDHQNCDYKTITQTALTVHIMGRHRTERNYKCSFEGCHKAFKTPDYRRQHESTHNQKYIKCNYKDCNRILTAKSYRIHMRDVHSETTHRCDWPGCDFTTNAARNLTKHSTVHSSEQPFVCDWSQCGKRFKKKCYLNDHLRIHKNEKPYACSWPGCLYRCCSDSNIIKHKKIHLKK